eukprot:Partr_v1_DN28379_c1_g1_i6_m79354 putative Serine hydrolase-like
MDIQFKLSCFGNLYGDSQLCMSARVWTLSQKLEDDFQTRFPFNAVAVKPPIEPYKPVTSWSKTIGKSSSGPNRSTQLILACHGWLDNSSTWMLLAPALLLEMAKWRPNVDFAVVAPDFAGHGLSYHISPSQGYPLQTHIRDMIEVIEQLNRISTDPLFFLAHSMGAGILSAVAALVPDRLVSMVSLENIGPFTRSSEMYTKWFGKYLSELRTLPGKKLPLYNSLEDAAIVRAKNTASGTLSMLGARALVDRGMMRTRGGKLTWRTDPQLRTAGLLSFNEQEVLAFLSQIKAPLLIIVAKDGYEKMFNSRPETTSTPWIDWKMRANVIPKSKIETLPGGHHFHLTETSIYGPDGMASVVCKWFCNASTSQANSKI